MATRKRTEAPPDDQAERPVDSDDNSVKLVPKLVISLGEERGEFLAKRNYHTMAMLKYNAAVDSGSESAVQAAIYRLLQTSVKAEDWDRFDEFLMENGEVTPEVFFGEIMRGLSELWAGESNLPLVQPSSNSSGPISETDDTSTLNSSEPDIEEGSPEPETASTQE